jgi:hypothetical protein
VLYAASSVPLQGFLNCIVYIKPRYLRRGSVITNASTASKICTFSWCCKKKAPSTVDVNKLEDPKKEPSELQSTSKLTKPPEDDAPGHQNDGSTTFHQSVLNSSMLGEGLPVMPTTVQDDQLTELDNEDETYDESKQSTLHKSVLQSSMLGERL